MSQMQRVANDLRMTLTTVVLGGAMSMLASCADMSSAPKDTAGSTSGTVGTDSLHHGKRHGR